MQQANDAEVRRWDERYARGEYLFGTEPNAYLQRHACIWQHGQHILCVADGEGRNSVWLTRQGLQVTAFDPSRTGVEKARKLAQSAQVAVSLHVCDCDQWNWPEEAYDGIAAIFVQFADPPMRARLFANMIRSLKIGGSLILQGYTPRQLLFKTGGPAQESHLYTAPMLQGEFGALQVLALDEYETQLAEGSQHLGRSALIGLVARKTRST